MQYELTLLLPEEAEIKGIKELIASFAGKVEKEEKWGKRSLVYPIKKNTSAYYYCYRLEMDQKNIGELKKKLNFNEKLMRYLLLKIS